MKNRLFLFALLAFALLSTGCVGKKKFQDVSYQLDLKTRDLDAVQFELDECKRKQNEVAAAFSTEQQKAQTLESSKNEMISSLRSQIADLKKQRDQQVTQVEDLTVLSKTASENMGQTIKQLEQKDQYINYLMNAKSKADSINLALAVNLKTVLRQGIEDEDIEVKVDKTVVFINLSDKMLFQSGSFRITPRADEVLSKVASIIKSRPDLDLMVEGYTDNVPIKSTCMQDNWDLSVKRASAVVRILQNNYGVDPNKLIAAGRGEYNTLADNSTREGKAMNRRTRIILLPKLNQFYDLLKPSLISGNNEE